MTLQWAGLKGKNGGKNRALIHRRARDDVEKQ